MSSVQEKIKLKRAQIDTWSIREQLCLASSVLRCGDQNWMSVSRSLKAFGDSGRPSDWFSQKSCAVQYSNLLENVETPKRKKRTDKGDTSVETPSESIVRRLTQERIEELKRLLNEDRQIYAKLKEEVLQVKTGCADDKLPEMSQEIEEEKRQKERKAEAHERWLREREKKKIELEREWKPPVAPASSHRRKHHPKIHRRNSSQSEPSSEAESALDSPLSEPLNVDGVGEESVQEAAVEPEPSQTPTSPLLTSLLKSPSPAPASQGSSILHSAITAHRGASPTITSLLSSAPGVPTAGSMGTVAPPTTVSSSLKNLVSSAISSEQAHHQPPPHNPSPAAGAPTLSMLLELPPSLPGKPLPELPSATKTTTLPPSTVSAIVSAAIAPTAGTNVVAMKSGSTAVPSSASPKITPSALVSDSSEVQSPSQEVKIPDCTSGDDVIEVLQVDSAENAVDVDAQLLIETKEELVEEVLIEEVLVNDDSVIESELLASQISDVVVATEQEDAKEEANKDAEEIKLNEPVSEVSQSSEVLSQKEEINSEMVADVDSTSTNSGLSVTIESSTVNEGKSAKDECIETIIGTSSQELVSEIVTEETAAVDVVPTTETELTSGAVAEVFEISDDQETTIETEVVGECGPCMQELEDMEVIILDKGIDEVQIVEDMKELECELVEVVMRTQEKVDEIKEVSELEHSELKSDEITSAETSSIVTDTIIECESIESADNANNKSDISTTEPRERSADTDFEKVENEEVLNHNIQSVEVEEEEDDDDDDQDDDEVQEEIEEEVEMEEEEEEQEGEQELERDEEEDEKPVDISDSMTTENGCEIEGSDKPREIIVERSSIEDSYEEPKEYDIENENNSDHEQEEEELSGDIHEDVTVNTSESHLVVECGGDLGIEEQENKEVEDIELSGDIHEDVTVNTSESHLVVECGGDLGIEEQENKEVEDIEISRSGRKDTEEIKESDNNAVLIYDITENSLPCSILKENEMEILKKETLPENEDLSKESIKKETINKEVLKKDIKEHPILEKDSLQELSKKDDISKEAFSKKNQSPRGTMRKDALDEEKKDLQLKELKQFMLEEKREERPEEPAGDDTSRHDVRSSSNEISKKEMQKINESVKKMTNESLKKDIGEKADTKEGDISKREMIKREVQSPSKEMVNDTLVKETKQDMFAKEYSRNEVSKDSGKKDDQLEQDNKKTNTSKEIPKKDLSLRKEIPASKKEVLIPKKDLPVKEGIKESLPKHELSRRDNKDDLSIKGTLKRSISKEERKEPSKDDVRKRLNIKEITKSLKRTDSDVKNLNINSESEHKIDKGKKDNETKKEECKEIRREKLGKESQQKREDKNKEEPSAKESKTIGNSMKLKLMGEEGNKITPILEKKEGKEYVRANDKPDIVPKQVPVDYCEEKSEKRQLLRSETPSTEDDKTNYAETPKVIGRKRLPAVNIMDSVPNSPAPTTDEEREYKSWKKSIMLLYGRLATHKYASLFLRPITDDQAPGYSSVVYRPIDLLTIKKNIETGVIRTTVEFQRDVMLMFLNAVMYNKSNHVVNKMAKQMQKDAMIHIQDFINTQMLVQVVGDGVPIRRETRTTEANKQRDILGSPSNVTSQDESETNQLYKRKRNTASDSLKRDFKKKKPKSVYSTIPKSMSNIYISAPDLKLSP